MRKDLFTRRLTAILLCAVLTVCLCPAASATDLITTQQELLTALNDARDGDVLTVGDIDFTAPDGIFKELTRLSLRKSVTLRSGLSGRKAVFQNGSLLLQGSKLPEEGLVCSFENILFDGGVDAAALTASDWERPYDPSLGQYTGDVPQKAQYAVSFTGNVTAVFTGCVFRNYMYEYGGALWCRYRDYTDNPHYLDLYGDYSACKLDISLEDCNLRATPPTTREVPCIWTAIGTT